MKYICGVLMPLATQVLVVYLVIKMNVGNGSFVGMGAYLLGMLAIPVSAIINVVYIIANPKLGVSQTTVRCFLLALITPILLFLMSVIG